jgi:lysophospholipase L1-like esterase
VNWRILCFGASLTYGSWDQEGGWVDRLKRDMHRDTHEKEDGKYQVFNLGIGGDTSIDVLQRLEAETLARKAEDWEYLTVICVGINDTRIPAGVDRPIVGTEEYEQNIEKLLTTAQAQTSKVLLVGLTPVANEARCMMVRAYDQRASEVARRLGVSRVDLFDAAMATDYRSWLVDRLHVDSRGHQWIYEQVKPHVLELLNS